MIMEHVQKMFLVPQQELDKLKQNASAAPLDMPIRKAAENELDSDIQKLLATPSVDMYEKAKMYSNILRRYLTFVKQGNSEKNLLTLSLPDEKNPEPANSDAEGVHIQTVSDEDHVLTSILKHMPTKCKKNAEHILDVLSKSKDRVSWSPNGEMIVHGSVVSGSNMFDLLKNVTASYRVNEDKRPIGWRQFLKQMALMNIPLTAVPNSEVRQSIELFKRGDLPQSGRKRRVSVEMSTPKRGRDMSRRRDRPWLTY